jgi:hypothetical protein
VATRALGDSLHDSEGVAAEHGGADTQRRSTVSRDRTVFIRLVRLDIVARHDLATPVVPALAVAPSPRVLGGFTPFSCVEEKSSYL